MIIFLQLVMFAAVIALLVQHIRIPRKVDIVLFFACAWSLLTYYVSKTVIFLAARPDISLWFWAETHVVASAQALDFWPAPVTFIPFVLQFAFLMWFWRRQRSSLVNRAGLVLLFTALWIFPTDLEWIAFTAAKWWAVHWYIDGAPWLHIVYELAALNAALIMLIPLIRKGVLRWDRWTLIAELLNIVYLLFVFLPAASPWATDLNIWLDLRDQLPPALILWTLRIGSRSVNYVRWFAWIRPWRRIPD